MVQKLLTCPQCSSSFRVPAAAIGDEGRQVRCSACAHQWLANKLDLQSIDGEHDESNIAETSDAHATPEISDEAGKTSESDAPSNDDNNGNSTTDEDDTSEDEALAVARRIAARAQRDAEESARTSPLSTLLLVANIVCFFAIGAALLVYLRGPLHQQAVLSSIYDSLGYRPTNDVQLADITFSSKSYSGVWQYAMNGKFVNHSDAVVPVPTIRVYLFRDSDTPYKEWTISPGDDDVLEARESKIFNIGKFKSYADDNTRFMVDIGSPMELSLRE